MLSGNLPIPAEVFVTVLSFLEPADILAVALVNKHWASIVENESLWMRKCQSLWSNKFSTPLQLHPRIRLNESLVAKMTLDELKTLARFRKVALTGKKRKDIERQLLEAPLPPESPEDQPEWTSKWKASYFVSQRDANRSRITVDELTGIKWAHAFKDASWNSKKYSISTFHPDNKYTREGFEGTLIWRLVDDKLYVASFPAFSAYRTSTWGWFMENEYVSMNSLAGPPFGIIPLVSDEEDQQLQEEEETDKENAPVVPAKAAVTAAGEKRLETAQAV